MKVGNGYIEHGQATKPLSALHSQDVAELYSSAKYKQAWTGTHPELITLCIHTAICEAALVPYDPAWAASDGLVQALEVVLCILQYAPIDFAVLVEHITLIATTASLRWKTDTICTGLQRAAQILCVVRTPLWIQQL